MAQKLRSSVFAAPRNATGPPCVGILPPALCLAALLLLLASGCATTMPQPARGSVPELTDVPFFPQTEFDCGPAALATLLTSAGIAVTPDQLVDQVYVDGLKGSLQAELMAATRRFAYLPVELSATLDTLLEELASGRPVLVLLNLGLARAPVWHYAVVVGYDAEAGRIILRSGEERARRERASRFLHQWQLADGWAFVATRPDDIPSSTSPEQFLHALVDAEPHLRASQSASAYAAALARWPEDSLALFLAANRYYADAKLADAAELYTRLLTHEPEHAAARNNLALVLLDRGCPDAARREARLALRNARAGPFVAAIEDTLAQIEQAAPSPAAAIVCAPAI